jgi:hypothetical protein
MKTTKLVSVVLSIAIAVAPQMAMAGDWWDTVKEKTSAAYNSTTEAASTGWDKTKAAYSTAASATSNAWDSTKAGTKHAWNSTTTWCGEHKEEIAATAIAVGTVVTYAYFNQSAPPQQPSYSNLHDSPSVGPGKPFTQWQKSQLLQENMARNNGVLRSDLSGTPLVPPQRYSTGYTPPLNEAQIDHIYPRSADGSNSFGNAQVLSRQENLLKSDSVYSGK